MNNRPTVRVRFNSSLLFRLRTSKRPIHFGVKTQQQQSQHGKWAHKFGVLGMSTGVIGYIHSQFKISNDASDINASFHKLKPDPNADTFEMGLYISSRNEEKVEAEHKRQAQSRGLLKYLYIAKFYIIDYVIDPLITFGRFLELSCIFLPVLIAIPISWFGHRDKKTGIKHGSRLWYRYVRVSLEIAGASFIKLGQWAASRTDIFPKEMCDELGNLHSNAKAHSLHQTKKIISKSFGLPFDEIFEEFVEKPLGVGAIAQVYVAKLSQKLLDSAKEIEKEEFSENQQKTKLMTKFSQTIMGHEDPKPNQWVAIKVLHPKVEIKIERDLKVMSFFANLIDCIPTMEWLSLPDEVNQFSMLMNLQLDLRIEGLNLKKFRENYKDRLDIHFPKPYLNFTTREILVEEFIQAVPLSRILELSANYGKGLSKEISDKGLDAFLKMLILDNFVHADLHPGNMMIRFYKNEMFPHEKEYRIIKSTNDSDTNQITSELLKLGDDQDKWVAKLQQLYEDGYHAEICFLDAGLVTELNETDRINFIDLFNALSEFDGFKAGELMIERSRSPETAIDKEIFALKVDRLTDRMKERTFTLGNISIGDLLDQVLGMVRQHHVRMEGDFITIIVAILLLEGVGRQLDPEMDLFASALPVLRQLGVQDGRKLLKNANTLSMIKVWLALEVRQFIHASVQDIHSLVMSDGLSPNI